MEKSIHTHLFAALVSTKEQRLAFMAGTPEPFAAEADFQDEATKLSEKIKSPEMETAAAQTEVRVLQLRAALDKNPGRKAKMDELVRGLRAREDADGALTDIKARTAKGNPEWDGIVKAIKSKEGTPAEQAQQLTKAKELIAQSFVDIKATDAAADKPYNYLSQIEAHNANVVKTKSLDTKNFELEGSAGVDSALLDGADIDLKSLETEHGTYMLSLEPLLKTAEGIKSADNPAGRKAAEEIVDAHTKAQKAVLEAKIKNILTFTPPQFNAEKQIAAVLANIKNIDDVVNTRLARKPAKTPNAEPKAPDTDPKTPKTDTEAQKTLVGSAIDIFNNAVNSVTTMAKDIVKKGSDAFTALQDTLTDKQKSELADKLNAELKKQGADKHVEINKDGKLEAKDGAPKEPEKAATPPEKEKSQLEKLLAFFKELIDFLRGESVKNGDIGALKAEVLSIDEQIAKIKKDTPDFNKKPEIQKQITDLEVKRNALQLKIDEGTKITNRVVSDAERFINGSSSQLFLRTGKDRQGNAFIACTKNTPEARGHLSYMTGRLQQIHPGPGFNQQAAVDQRVYFHIHGDVNINSNNRTNNSRTINNTNNVSGRNNTVSASADGSQNGANTQEQIGGVGATQDGTAKNKARVRPVAEAEQVIIPAEPMKPKLSVAVELPPMSGNL